MRKHKFRCWDGKTMYTENVCLIDGEFCIDLGGLDWDFNYLENAIGMEYLGKKDKNGIELCVGDIVSSDFYEPEFKDAAVIGYDEFEMRFVFLDSCGNLNGEQDAFKYGNLEVIGNIYENPELKG